MNILNKTLPSLGEPPVEHQTERRVWVISIPLFADTITKMDYISNQKKRSVYLKVGSQRLLLPKMYLSKTVQTVSIKRLFFVHGCYVGGVF